jgi:hypothetical protein
MIFVWVVWVGLQNSFRTLVGAGSSKRSRLGENNGWSFKGGGLKAASRHRDWKMLLRRACSQAMLVRRCYNEG